MSLLKTIEQNPASEPKPGKPAADRLVSGNPLFKGWQQDEAKDGKVRTGVWEASPGEYLSVKGETFEFCYLLQGVIELTEEGKPPVRYKAGDSFVMKPGFKGVWKTIETVRKLYVAVD